MSWWCKNPASDGEAVEVKIRTTFDAAENWVDSCKARRAQNEHLRKQNQQARARLADRRSKLLDDQKAAKEKLDKIHLQIGQLDELIRETEVAEVEINAVDEKIRFEEQRLAEREISLKDHLNSIAKLTTVESPGRHIASTVVSMSTPRADVSTTTSHVLKTPTTAPARIIHDSIEPISSPFNTPIHGSRTSV